MIEDIVNFFDGLIRKTRTKDFEQLAKEEHFEFFEDQAFSDLPIAMRDFYIFKKKKGTIKRVLVKTDLDIPETQLRIYDFVNYKDEIETTTIIEFENPTFKFSPFFIYPRSVFTKMKHLFVSEEMVFKDLADFNSNYKIEASNPSISYQQLKRSALALTNSKKKIYIEADDRYLIFYYKNKPLEIPDVRKDYLFALEFLDRMLYDQTNDFV